MVKSSIVGATAYLRPREPDITAFGACKCDYGLYTAATCCYVVARMLTAAAPRKNNVSRIVVDRPLSINIDLL